MALRIMDGDRPLFFYGQDYQSALEAYAAALLLRVVGPSIPAAAIISLLEWSIAAAAGAYLALRGTDRTTGIICGVAIVIGVPYTLHFTTIPHWGYPGFLMMGMLLLVQTASILEHGSSVARWALFGFTAGLGLHIGRQSIAALTAALLVIVIFRASLTSARRPRGVLLAGVALAAFLAGYAPEIWYRWHAVEPTQFAMTTDAGELRQNATFTVASIFGYFDAQPVSRLAQGTNFFGHFFSGLPDSSIFPDGPGDWLAAIIACGAMLLMSRSFVTKPANAPLLLLALLIVINIAVVILSDTTNGLLLSARRYLFPSAIGFSIWGGVFVARAVQHRSVWIRASGLALGVLIVTKIASDHFTLLRGPDELAELRHVAAALTREGVRYGLAESHADELIALTNQRLILVSLIYERIPEYETIVAREDRIAFIGGKGQRLEPFQWHGAVYDPAGAPHETETLIWSVYQKRPTP
jgi:hypothetical protein